MQPAVRSFVSVTLLPASEIHGVRGKKGSALMALERQW
jgi:hypothetical protein